MPSSRSRFGPFLVDRTTYRVTRGDDVVELTPKLLDLLLYLVDRPAALVTKEELLDALWPGANVTDNALAQAVSELREALEDDAGAPKYIKTIARRGYRFIAPVEAVDAAPAAPPRHEPGSETRGPAEETPAAIAVMDFANVGGDADIAWLTAGIAETVTGDLRARGHLRVVDRWSVAEAARRTNGSLQQVAADLHARLAVVGSFQRSANHLRITARIVDVASGEALADAKVDGAVDRIFELQDQIVAQFARELGWPGAAPLASVGSSDTRSLEAYRACTEAWLRLESLDLREMHESVRGFERAVSLDPNYALAYTGLANAEFVLYETTRSDNTPDVNLLDRAIEHARHAVGLSDRLAEAHATLALLLVSAWNSAEAQAAARRAVALEPANWRHLFRLGHASWGGARLEAIADALALHPEFAFAYFQMAMVYVARGELARAESVLRDGAAVQDRQIRRGERFPGLGLHWLLAMTRLAQGNVADAIDEFDAERRLADEHRLYGREFAMHAYCGRGMAMIAADRSSDAIAAFRDALALYPDHAQSRLGLASALRAAGSPREAERELAAVDAVVPVLAPSRPIEAAIVRALVLAARGDAAGAGSTLDRLLGTAPPGFAGWTLPVEPLLREVADTQAVQGALARLGRRAQ